MRRIPVSKWSECGPDGETHEVTLLNALALLLNGLRPEKVPRGFDAFRMFTRISRAFERAEKSGELVLEETEYHFLRRILESEIPAVWGSNKDVTLAIEAFMEAKPEEKE